MTTLLLTDSNRPLRTPPCPESRYLRMSVTRLTRDHIEHPEEIQHLSLDIEPTPENIDHFQAAIRKIRHPPRTIKFKRLTFQFLIQSNFPYKLECMPPLITSYSTKLAPVTPDDFNTLIRRLDENTPPTELATEFNRVYALTFDTQRPLPHPTRH